MPAYQSGQPPVPSFLAALRRLPAFQELCPEETQSPEDTEQSRALAHQLLDAYLHSMAEEVQELVPGNMDAAPVFTEAWPLAAAGTASSDPEETSLLIHEDHTHQLRFLRSIRGNTTFLTLEVIAEHASWDNVTVAVYEEATPDTPLREGVITAGTISWKIERKIVGKLQCKRVRPAEEPS